MKKQFLLILMLISTFTFAQNSQIEKLLNQQFEKEQKIFGSESDPEKPRLTKPFQIINDTLSFEFAMPWYNSDDEIKFTHREVALTDIQGFIKDYNIIFIAKEGSVKETTLKKDMDGNIMETKKNNSHLFFTELRKDSKDNSLQKKMLKAFKKAGYIITSEYWWD